MLLTPSPEKGVSPYWQLQLVTFPCRVQTASGFALQSGLGLSSGECEINQGGVVAEHLLCTQKVPVSSGRLKQNSSSGATTIDNTELAKPMT